MSIHVHRVPTHVHREYPDGERWCFMCRERLELQLAEARDREALRKIASVEEPGGSDLVAQRALAALEGGDGE